MKRERYWAGELGEKDDFGRPYYTIMIDGRTRLGVWANMNSTSWMEHGCGRLGPGYGQMYEKRGERWLKVEG